MPDEITELRAELERLRAQLAQSKECEHRTMSGYLRGQSQLTEARKEADGLRTALAAYVNADDWTAKLEQDAIDALANKYRPDLFAQLETATQRAKDAEQDKARLDWLMVNAHWCNRLTMYGEVREYRFDTPMITPTINIRAAIDAAIAASKQP